MWYETLLNRNLIPDPVIRTGIRCQLSQKLRQEKKGGADAQKARLATLIAELKASPIAIHQDAANTQHYELPALFFQTVLGRYLKYSSGYWPEGIETLDASEAAMLNLYVQRAQIRDGQEILDLGCGWGSLSLYLAGRFPNSRILGVSNSKPQKEFIDAQIQARGIKNVEITTADIAVFDTPRRFDRILSVEMFEHMRNYEKLFDKVAGWMKPDALLFIHIFTHKSCAYPFDDGNAGSWMARYFFTGGMMPSEELFLFFQKSVRLRERWRVDGTHYQKTCEAWLAKMDANRDRILPLFETTYGPAEAARWWGYWRIFFMACAELFGFQKGREWAVSHYLFEKKI